MKNLKNRRCEKFLEFPGFVFSSKFFWVRFNFWVLQIYRREFSLQSLGVESFHQKVLCSISDFCAPLQTSTRRSPALLSFLPLNDVLRNQIVEEDQVKQALMDVRRLIFTSVKKVRLKLVLWKPIFTCAVGYCEFFQKCEKVEVYSSFQNGTFVLPSVIKTDFSSLEEHPGWFCFGKKVNLYILWILRKNPRLK